MIMGLMLFLSFFGFLALCCLIWALYELRKQKNEGTVQ